MSSAFDGLIDQTYDIIEKNNNKKKIVDKVIDPIIKEITNKYSSQINTLYCISILLIILLGVNLYYSIQLNSKLK